MADSTFLLPEAPVATLEEYLVGGGGRGIAAAHTLGPEGTLDEVDGSGLRGRGGAGFPTGVKWQAVVAADGTHRFAVCNAAEGEPATFKDRALLRANPYQVVEGLAIAALAVGARQAYVGIKASFVSEREALTRSVVEMESAELLGDLTVNIVAGPDEYLFGEEKALLEVLEGHDPLPRTLPPHMHGLFATRPEMGWEGHAGEARHPHESNPTLVNNVETLANVAHILANGADWFRSIGTEESPGTLVCTMVGDVRRPGVVEVEMGTPLAELLTTCGSPPDGRRVKAVLSGVANPVLTEEVLEVRLCYEAMEAIGSGLGAAGFAVYDETACMVKLARVISQFLYVESCNQCPACKLGTGEVTAALERVDRGEGSEDDIELTGWRLRSVTDGNRCFLPVQEQRVIGSLLNTFPEEFTDHLEQRACPLPRELVIPKVVDLQQGHVAYDDRQPRKRPDWTYEEG